MGKRRRCEDLKMSAAPSISEVTLRICKGEHRRVYEPESDAKGLDVAIWF
jgi:hypothetical protein